MKNNSVRTQIIGEFLSKTKIQKRLKIGKDLLLYISCFLFWFSWLYCKYIVHSTNTEHTTGYLLLWFCSFKLCEIKLIFRILIGTQNQNKTQILNQRTKRKLKNALNFIKMALKWNKFISVSLDFLFCAAKMKSDSMYKCLMCWIYGKTFVHNI